MSQTHTACVMQALENSIGRSVLSGAVASVELCRRSDTLPASCRTFASAKEELDVLSADLERFREFAARQTLVRTIAAASDSLCSALPLLGTEAFAVVLYEKQLAPGEDEDFAFPSRAKLICSYESGKNSGHRESAVLFNPQDGIVPQGTFAGTDRHLVLLPLSSDDAHFGYALYGMGNLHPAVAAMLHDMLFSLLSAAVMFTSSAAITQQQRAMLRTLETTNTELSDMTYKDELTGLLNRRGILTLGQESILLSLEMEQSGVVVFADMDGLKSVNDTYGHDAGDTAIKAMGALLRTVFRGNDMVGRMGGDEFVVIATGMKPSLMPRIQERLEAAEQSWHEQSGLPFRLGISMGYTEFTEENHNLEELLAVSDKAMYEEKMRHHSRRGGGAS